MKWADMSFGLKLATAPAAEPLTYSDVRDSSGMRLPSDNEQAQVTDLIATARQRVEADTGLRLITQAWDLTFDVFPEDAIYLPIEPVLAVTSIKTTSVAGIESTVTASNYQLDATSTPPRIVLSDSGSWPEDIRRTAGIVVRLSVGYGASGASVPAPLRQAMRELVRLMYAPTQGTIAAPSVPWAGYDALIAQYRNRGIA